MAKIAVNNTDNKVKRTCIVVTEFMIDEKKLGNNKKYKKTFKSQKNRNKI